MSPCSRLTALGTVYTPGGFHQERNIDRNIAALVNALPQLRALCSGHCSVPASDIGMLRLQGEILFGCTMVLIAASFVSSRHPVQC